MDATVLVKSMTPEVYAKLLQAVETGKWLDGSDLTEQTKRSQYASCYALSGDSVTV